MKQFFRHTNLSRLAGLASVVVGELFVDKYEMFSLPSGPVHSNAFIVTGVIAFAWPLIKEGYAMWRSKKTGSGG